MPKNQMRQIQQQAQQVQSISLHSQQSVIEQYNQLQFSDQIERSDDSSQAAELSMQKLKYLGIDKFPGPYNPKLGGNSQTQIHSGNQVSYSQSRGHDRAMAEFGRLEDNLYSRKKRKSKNKDYSMQQKQQFNIDSFLNSRPTYLKNNQNTSYRSGQILIDHEHSREQNNLNPLAKVLQQKQIHGFGCSQGRRNKIFKNQHNKSVNKIYEQRNQEIRKFVQKSIRNQHKQLHRKYQECYNIKETGQQSSESMTLITLPQPIQYSKMSNNKVPSKKSRSHRKNASLLQLNQPKQDQGTFQNSNQLYRLRFEQAKINFMDNFLPETLRIGNNPYNFLKYANSKTRGYLRIF